MCLQSWKLKQRRKILYQTYVEFVKAVVCKDWWKELPIATVWEMCVFLPIARKRAFP